MQGPSMPQSGKDGVIYLNHNDGIPVVNFPLTLQAFYSYYGKPYTDRMYLLGGTKMINNRPSIATSVTVDGVIDGLDVTPTASNNEIAVSAGNIQVSGVPTAIAADASVSITRPASGKVCYVGISVDKSAKTITVTKGTDGDAVADGYGSGAGQKPLIPVGDVLRCYLKINSTAAPIAYSEIEYADCEFSSTSFDILPSIGGVRVSRAFKKLHVGGIGRVPMFTGKYIDDDLLDEVAGGQSWKINANSSAINAVTLAGGASQTNISGWTYSFPHLFQDVKSLDATYNREGFIACKLALASGHFFRFIGSTAPSITNDPGSFVSTECSGSITDRPYWSGQ